MHRASCRALAAAAALTAAFVLTGCPPPSTCDGGSCDGGTAGPECEDDNPCAAGFDCVSGSCEECPLGTEGCACDDDSCDDGLACGEDGRCADPGCPEGTDGCPCLADDSCPAGDDGALLLCDRGAGRCVRVTPEPDEAGNPTGPQPSLTCHTPCNESITLADGTFRYCSPEGLMEGCLGTLTCVDGSCVGESELPPTCNADVDCPDHQACHSGFCLSNCSLDSDCGDGAVCASTVCRKSCQTTPGATGCPSSFTCQTVDGQDGWCMPQLTSSEAAPQDVPEPMVLSTQSIVLNNNRVTGQVLLTNASDRPAPVVVSRVEHTEIDAGGRTVVTQNPLHWLTLSAVGSGNTVLAEPSQDPEIQFEVLPGETVAIQVGDAFNESLSRWEGLLRITSTRLGRKDVFLEYSTLPDGQWAGTSYYFIDFPTGTTAGDVAVDNWLASLATGTRNDKLAKARLTQNALLLMWTEFRTNPLFTLQEWDAVMQATTQTSWALGNLHDACRAQFVGETDAECYAYADPNDPNDTGLRIFTDSADLDIPQGVLEMPFVVRLQGDSSAPQPYTFSGRMETGRALQFPGLPPATLRFAIDPESCETPGAQNCLVPVAGFEAVSLVGGRYELGSAPACDVPGFEKHEVPWLVSDFLRGTSVNDDGIPVRTECRESRFPADPGASSLAIDQNLSLAGANPLPDGRVRRRTIELLDGVMVNQDTLLLLVREHFEANLQPPAGQSTSVADFQAYSLIRLGRNGADLSQEDNPFEPGVVPDEMSFTDPAGKIENTCDPDLVAELLGGGSLAGNEAAVASKILTGLENVLTPPDHVDGTDYPGLNELHYLCHATGRIDGGPSTFTTKEGCPAGSGVTYFFYTGPGNIADDPCQGTAADRCPCVTDDTGDCVEVDCADGAIGSCADLFDDVQFNDDFIVNVPFQCNMWNGSETAYLDQPDPGRITCNDDRFNLRTGKLFYDPTTVTEKVTPPLETMINDAFRYKTRFVSRTGATLGFVPDVCASEPSILPYCYDPAAIEEVRERVGCLVDIFSSGVLHPINDAAVYEATRDFLQGAFSFYQDVPFGPTRDGFERLYSELLVMLGDEALTGAVASRFDLAGTQISSFRGDWLEPDGIQLSGGAGYEMVLLYRAHQYYQLVLDRFMKVSPALWQGLQLNQETKNFITLDSISTYFNRVILASTKKARASSEIARRYQSFNRADLARHVIERAYAEAYLESVTIGQFMRRSTIILDATEVDALNFELTQAQRQYRQALQRMRQDYQEITDEVTFFGDAPDYVPFPSAGKFDLPAPQRMIERATEALSIAKEREERALSSNRQFDVDAAQFQSELSRIRIQYEDQLSDICGTFVGTDDHVYPAVAKYADLHPVASVFGEPCGLMGNGGIFDAMADIEARRFELRAEIADIRAVFERVEIEQTRVDEECAGRVDIADIGFKAGNRRVTLRTQINDTQRAIGEWEKTLSELDRGAQVASAWAQVADSVVQGLQACTGDLTGTWACPVAGVAAVVAGAGYTASAIVQSIALDTQISANADIRTLENTIDGKEEDLERLQRDTDYAQAVGECCLDANWQSGTACNSPGPLMTNSEAQVDTILTELLRAELEASRAELELQRAVGRLAGLRNEVSRLQALQAETEQHLINVEAARNDPNIRIYANADVLDADKAFRLALKAAFRATRMYEYYTATSYAAKEDLFLVRMAGRGENNLEDYLLDLQYAFQEFEQSFGTPSLRVHVLSLMDDIFRIPRVDEEGRALLPAQRTAMLRERLNDPVMLDDNGYIRVPFSTSVSMTSPLTAIHKVDYVEAEIQGSDLGDRVGRLYLTSKGTATIRDLDNDLGFYRMDPVTAVINPYFNGVRLFDPEVYQENRLNSRPFANTLWELGLNLKDEEVNEDINVNSITDIRLYLFYTDFTQL